MFLKVEFQNDRPRSFGAPLSYNVLRILRCVSFSDLTVCLTITLHQLYVNSVLASCPVQNYIQNSHHDAPCFPSLLSICSLVSFTAADPERSHLRSSSSRAAITYKNYTGMTFFFCLQVVRLEQTVDTHCSAEESKHIILFHLAFWRPMYFSA